MSENLQRVVVYTVLVTWVLNFAAGLLPFMHYDPRESINGIFMAVVGGAIAIGNRDRSDRAGGRDE